MDHNKKDPLLLGRPFFNTTNVVLHVFNGFNMHKYTKNKQPKVQPQKIVK
jgi:hypothetical protein